MCIHVYIYICIHTYVHAQCTHLDTCRSSQLRREHDREISGNKEALLLAHPAEQRRGSLRPGPVTVCITISISMTMLTITITDTITY